MSRNLRRLISRYEKELTPFSTSLAAEFQRSAQAMGDLVEPEEIALWAEDGLELARRSWRSWEAASEYFRASPQLLPLMGVVPGLKCFIAAVLGGIGSIPGAMLGGFLLGVGEIMIVAFFPELAGYKYAFAYLALILVLLWKPTGLLGKVAEEKA